MSPTDALLKLILGAYFSNSRCIVLINDDFNLNFQINLPMLSLNLKNGQTFQNLYNYIGCQDFILNVNSPASVFRFIEENMQLYQDRFNKRKYIILPKENQIESSFDILKSDEILHVSDLLIITFNRTIGGVGINNIKNFLLEKQFVYNVWTHRYVGYKKNNEAYLLDIWFSTNYSFLYNHNLFPNKLLNQKGRFLKTATFNYEPYVIVEPQKDGTYLYMGSEMMTLFYFAKHYNMTIMPVINEFDYWGEIWDNWTGNGLLGNLVEDNADIGAAALYTWASSYKYLDLSKPSVRTGITCLVPAPKLAAGWMTPLYVYAPKTWMAVMGTFLASLLTLYSLGIMQKLNDADPEVNGNGTAKRNTRIFGKVLLAVAKPFVMQNVTNNEISKDSLGRYLMGLVFMTTLVLGTTYYSGLATIMTIPRYENPINSVTEFVNSGLNWGATQDAWLSSIQEAKEPNLIKIVARFKALSEENLRSLSLTGEFAFSLERLPNGDYAVGSYIEEDVIQNFHLMTEDFYWEQCVFMLRKNSVLLPYIDIFVLRVFEGGLISVWQNQAATQYMNQKVQKAVRFYHTNQKPGNIVKLTLTHVQGAFGILAFGNGFAFVVFLVELFYNRFFKQVLLSK